MDICVSIYFTSVKKTAMNIAYLFFCSFKLFLLIKC